MIVITRAGRLLRQRFVLAAALPVLVVLAALGSFAALGSLSVELQAQNVTARDKIVAVFPAGAKAVVSRLSELGELPDGAWKIHSGDLAHGEAVSLSGQDEADWKPIAVEETAPKDAAWFRQTVVVPETLHGYDLTGARVWFQFHANANGPMPQIIYFNGRRVALGDDLEPIVMLDSAKPGDKVVIAVKLLHTVDIKRFRGATMRIDVSEGRPNPSDLGTEFLSAALLIPSLAPGDASKMKVLSDAVEAVDLKALDAHDQAKFDASLLVSQQKLEVLRPLLQTLTLHLTGNSHIDAAWLWPWTETVDAVKRTFGTALQLMYEYPKYTYTQSAAAYNEWMAEKYPDMNAQIKQRIQEGRWEIVGGMWVEPDLNMPDGESLVRQLLVGKRWYKQAYGVDVRIGWNPDSFGYNWQLPQIYKKSGVDYFVTQKMAWNDTNQLPFKLFWWESPDGSKVLAYFPHDYANDNLRQTRLADDLATARAKATGLTEMMDLYGVGDHGGGPTRAILDEGFHWTPESTTGKSVTATVGPKIEFGLAQPFFSAVEKQIAPESKEWNYASIAKGYTAPAAVAGKVAIPTWNSELYFEYHRGVMTTQANHKRNMRESEEQVLNAEKWASLAWVLTGAAVHPYPSLEITEDWKKVLFNQFHDLAAGSGIGVIYKDAQKDYDVVRASTSEITRSSLQALVERMDTQGEGIPIVVFNPLGMSRTDKVHLRLQIPYQEGVHFRLLEPHVSGPVNLPSGVTWDKQTGIAEMDAEVGVAGLGYETYRLVLEPDNGVYAVDSLSQGSQVTETASEIELRRRSLDVKVDKVTGCITSLKLISHQSAPMVPVSTGGSHPHDVEMIAPGGCANQLQAFKDTPKDYDAWNVDPGTLDQAPTLLMQADSVEVVGAKSSSPAVRVSRHWQSSTFVQTISLNASTNQVDVDNEIDWHETHVLLKAAFPLAVTSDHATYEIPYGSIERTTKRTNSWEKAQFEVPALRWADLSGKGSDGQVSGLSVLNESKYAYDAAGSVLRLTLLRSPIWPDPEADRGHHHFHYALYPHLGTWKEAETVVHGWEYNYPMTAVVATAHPGPLESINLLAGVYRMDPSNTVVLTALKKAEDGDALIVRLYEWAGNSSKLYLSVPPGMKGARVANMLEEPTGDWLPIDDMRDLNASHGTTIIPVPIHPYEILTLRVDYPEKK